MSNLPASVPSRGVGQRVAGVRVRRGHWLADVRCRGYGFVGEGLFEDPGGGIAIRKGWPPVDGLRVVVHWEVVEVRRLQARYIL